MTRTTLAALAALATLALASTASATPSCEDSQTITIGSIDSGGRGDLCACDNTKEVLREGTDNGTSKLQVKWTFSNLPAGSYSLHFKGTRPNNSDGDNFQFYYTTGNQNFGVLIPGAIIDHAFAPAGGVTIFLETTTTTKTFTVFLADTAGGTNLDTVSLDCVQIDDGQND